MSGETAKSDAICLRIRPWSRTSHVVIWLTPSGKLSTVVKGAVRPKSAFLGQYDLNYTCETVAYVRGKGDLHPLREATPLKRRDALRTDYRRLALADRFREITEELAPQGPDAADWFALLDRALDRLAEPPTPPPPLVAELLDFELQALRLAGLSPELEAENGAFTLRGERQLPVSPAVARTIRRPLGEKNREILLDTARVIGVFYCFHLDCSPETRRTVLKLISTNEEGTGTQDG